MDFMDVVRSRRSIRSFLPTPVPSEAMEHIRESVMLAPTACNLQPFKVIFVKDPDLLNKLRCIYGRNWLSEAPMIAVVAGNYETCWKRLEGNPIADVDCAIVMEHIILAAASEGLGSCWICAFERGKLDEVLNLNGAWHSVAMSPIGYPAKAPAVGQKKKTADQLFEVR